MSSLQKRKSFGQAIFNIFKENKEDPWTFSGENEG
jgi:hypothetical protein